VLRDLEGAVATARRVDAGEEGRLRISFVGSALLSLVPTLVQRFRDARPDVELRLRERSTEDQLRGVKSGNVDIGLVPLPIDVRGVHSKVLLRERTVAALPTGHPLAALRRVPLRRVALEPLVLFPRSQAPGLHDHLLASLSRTGATPSVAQYAAETQTIVGLVAAGIGVSLVPESVQRLVLPGLAYRPVVGAPMVELAAVTRPDHDSPLVRAFLAVADS
jgi:DNA-binding transcriptional LysR family regulator